MLVLVLSDSVETQLWLSCKFCYSSVWSCIDVWFHWYKV